MSNCSKLKLCFMILPNRSLHIYLLAPQFIHNHTAYLSIVQRIENRKTLYVWDKKFKWFYSLFVWINLNIVKLNYYHHANTNHPKIALWWKSHSTLSSENDSCPQPIVEGQELSGHGLLVWSVLHLASKYKVHHNLTIVWMNTYGTKM